MTVKVCIDNRSSRNHPVNLLSATYLIIYLFDLPARAEPVLNSVFLRRMMKAGCRQDVVEFELLLSGRSCSGVVRNVAFTSAW